MAQNSYTQAIKQAILKSRYQAALLANREMLMLYFNVGEYISKNSREGKWGTNTESKNLIFTLFKQKNNLSSI
jgi:hypothetical protein